jgi:hypothetical protein
MPDTRAWKLRLTRPAICRSPEPFHATQQSARASLIPPHIRAPAVPKAAIQIAAVELPAQADERPRHHFVSQPQSPQYRVQSARIMISQAILHYKGQPGSHVLRIKQLPTLQRRLGDTQTVQFGHERSHNAGTRCFATSLLDGFRKILAEREGFEPSLEVLAPKNGLANCLFHRPVVRIQ